ncbi:hypothetical protein BB14905_16825 [Bacillus sp. B14905]|nr:hypothetical protein BB14905_16825 [Bacillus sp. B14905]
MKKEDFSLLMLYRIDNDSLFRNEKTMYAIFEKGVLY